MKKRMFMVLSKKVTGAIKGTTLQKMLKKMTKTKNAGSREAAKVLAKLSKEACRERQRIQAFVRGEVKREVKRATPYLKTMITESASSLKRYLSGMLKQKPARRKTKTRKRR